jgi:5-methylcytosine-specific restriction endonuclease McrA
MARPCIDCGQATSKTRCPTCSYRNEKTRRPNFRDRGYDAEYQHNRALLLADHPTCAICGTAPATTADHITPRSQGGTNQIDNLRPACHPCNSARGAKQPGPTG